MGRPHFLQPLLRRSAGLHAVRNRRSGQIVASELEMALTSEQRRRGLLGRDGLRPGQALVIAPTSLVHTFAMRFAIDIIFVARSGEVVKVQSRVPRRRIAGAWRGFAVIEMAAGEASRGDTRPGDLLEVVPLQS